jgi:mono/diheme cytochrome c family protein
MNMFHCREIFVGVAVLGFAISVTAQESHVGTLTGHAADGAKYFPRYCNGCHGVRGDGKGSFAPYLDPRPRDFTAATFKCRSTSSGSLPLDEDLYRTMDRGIVTASMPSWASLTPQVRVDIIAFLKTFSARFAKEKPGQAIVIPPEGTVTIGSLKHGAELYQKHECATCHGQRGLGDGPSSGALLDMKHQPIPPYDFTVTERCKCATTNTDLYRVFMTGMDGTPMMSYSDKMTPDETWDLVHYVRTLQATRKSIENNVLKAAGGRQALAPTGAPAATPVSAPTETVPPTAIHP